MSNKWQTAGPNHVPSYQMSGIPFVTSSAASEVSGPDGNSVSLPIKVSFPYVTKFLTIRNTGINELRVGFSQNGVVKQGERLASDNADKTSGGSNFFLIPTGSGGENAASAQSIQTFDLRCKEVYFLSNATKSNTPGAAQATSFSLIAGLTTIPAKAFPILTGSINATGSFEGVG